jgi:WD40 repeat protein
MHLWDVKTRTLIRSFSGHEKPVWSVAFTPDGRRGVSGGYDQVIKVWDLATGNPVQP